MSSSPGRSPRNATTPPAAEVVSFGMVAPATLLVVDTLPPVNTGLDWKQVTEFISDDGAIVATVLRGWDVRAGLIGTTLGNDAAGRRTIRRLKELGIVGNYRTSSKASTPYELNISDSAGNRTYFWRRDPQVLATLDSADLSMVQSAKLLYVDWYDGDHIIRPMAEAARCGVPVFLNFEHGHENMDLLSRYAPHASICQAVTDHAQTQDNPLGVAHKLLEAGVSTALVTVAGGGCLAATRGETVRVHAPQVSVVDGCGAGATFSAGYIYGHLRGWSLEEKVRFGVAAASLKCTVVGPRAFPLAEVQDLARQLEVEHLAANSR